MTHHAPFDPASFGLGAPLWQRVLPHDEATRALGAALARALRPADFLGLVGTLGAGKTTLVQGLVHALDPTLHTHSPTYTLINRYPTSPAIIHIDLYRLERHDDLESIGYWDAIEHPSVIACVEWFALIPGAWPERGAALRLEPIPQGRLATLWCHPDDDDLSSRLAALATP